MCCEAYKQQSDISAAHTHAEHRVDYTLQASLRENWNYDGTGGKVCQVWPGCCEPEKSNQCADNKGGGWRGDSSDTVKTGKNVVFTNVGLSYIKTNNATTRKTKQNT